MASKLADALRIIADMDPEELVGAIDALDPEGEDEKDMELPFPAEQDDEEDLEPEDMAEEEVEGDLPPAQFKKKK